MTLKLETKLKKLVLTILDDYKAENCQVLDVRGISDVADFMIVATGTSRRHLKAMADAVSRNAKQAGFMPMGVSGTAESDWILIDLGAVIVQLMLSQVRDLYALEALWGVNLSAKETPKKKSKSKTVSLKKSKSTLETKKPKKVVKVAKTKRTKK